MKKNYFQFLLVIILMGFVYKPLFSQLTQTFSFTGNLQTFVVPSCVGQITVDMAGAAGGNAIDVNPNNTTIARGGRVQGVLTVTPGQVFNIYVGGVGSNTSGVGGYNGGGGGGLSSAGSGCSGGYAGSGGGATDIRIGGITLSDRVIVAGGGGGAGRDYCNGSCQPCGCGGSGGSGGGLTGVNGQAAYNCNNGYPGSGINFGGGGGTTSGGFAGLLDGNNNASGTIGQLGTGGSGAGGAYDVAGGGGGGGFYGGGGGGSAGSGSGVGGGGGGGGSSFLGTLTSAATTTNYQLGNGYVILTYNVIGGIVNATANNTLICLGANVNLIASGTVLSYTWNTGSNSNSITISPTSNTVITVSATNTVGCISTSSLAIIVNTTPTLAINTSTNNTCLGKTATLTASGANTYTWSNNVTNGVSFTPSVTNTYTVFGQNACATTSAITSISITPIAVNVLSNPTLVCAGSTSTLVASAAATGYTWSPVIASGTSIIVSPQVSTIYSVTVSDGTCSGIGTVAVNANPVPTISAVPSITTVCSGVPVTFIASGGISYTWNPIGFSGATFTIAPTSPTGYQVIGSNSLGCTSIANVAVITDPSPTLNLTADNNLICKGDLVNLTSSGANAYLWDNGATTPTISVNPLVTTIYSLTGTTNGCSTTETVMISVFLPSLSVTGPSAICTGETATITASGANTYAWGNGFNTPAIFVTPSSTTLYTLTALTASAGITCPSDGSFQVTVKANPTITTAATKTTICRNEPLIITASGGASYLWSNGATTSSIVITSSLVTTVSYSVIGTAANGCVSTSTLQAKVNSCLGLNENNGHISKLEIYPNPSVGEFNVEYDSEITLSLSNELGQLIKVLHLNAANNYKVKVIGLSSGIYFITSQSSNQNIERKIVIN